MKIKSPFIIIILSSVLIFQVITFVARFPAGSEYKEGTRNGIAHTETAMNDVHYIKTDNDLLTPNELASRFFSSQNASATTSTVIKEQTRETPVIPEFNHYVLLGSIENESGIKRIYLKHIESGRVIQARFDGTAEDGIRYYEKDEIDYIEISGHAYTIEREKK